MVPVGTPSGTLVVGNEQARVYGITTPNTMWYLVKDHDHRDYIKIVAISKETKVLVSLNRIDELRSIYLTYDVRRKHFDIINEDNEGYFNHLARMEDFM